MRPAARGLWRRDPMVRLHHHPGDDSLVAEILQCPPADVVTVHDALLVEFDGAEDAALPATVCLTGVRSDPGSPEAALAADLLGATVWAAAEDLVARGGGCVEVELDGDEAGRLEVGWAGLAGRLRAEALVVGVEVLPREVRAGLVDSCGRVFRARAAALEHGSVQEVVDVIAGLVGELGGRAPIGVQLGGPVDSGSGLVLHYAKPVAGGALPWNMVPLGDELEELTGREVLIFNDAQALAHWEVAFGLGTVMPTFAVLFVGEGIGAKFVLDGVVQPFPMEVGVFVPNPWLAQPGTSGSIQEEASAAAMVRSVARMTGVAVTTLAQAAELACSAHDDGVAEKVAAVFREAGEDIALGMAAIQLMLEPRAWAVHVPGPLDDPDTAAGAAFGEGLRTVDRYLGYRAVLDPDIVTRPTGGDSGVVAAAVATRRQADRRSSEPADRADT